MPSPPNVDSVRREIIFPKYFLESYFFELVRTIDDSTVDEDFSCDQDNRGVAEIRKILEKVQHDVFADSRILSDSELDESET